MKKLIYSLLVISAIFASCSDDETTSAPLSGTVTINATSSTQWAYFSFDQDSVVALSDSANSLDWDLAFKRSNIITNGGLSGKGQAGAFDSKTIGAAGFEALTSVPDTAIFAQDDSVLTATMGSYVKSVANPVLKDCFTLSFSSTKTTLIPTDHIYILKTAKGKYAKVWFVSYYHTDGTSAYYTIKYEYQPNGSKSF